MSIQVFVLALASAKPIAESDTNARIRTMTTSASACLQQLAPDALVRRVRKRFNAVVARSDSVEIVRAHPTDTVIGLVALLIHAQKGQRASSRILLLARVIVGVVAKRRQIVVPTTNALI